MMVQRIEDDTLCRAITRAILEALPDWFGVPEAVEEYVADSAGKPYFAAFDDAGAPVGFLYLAETGRATVGLHCMGVLREWHRRGVGRALFGAAKEAAREMGYAFMQVKTVKMGLYDDYDATNRFYLSLGFQEFEVFPLLWDEANPCQIYVMAL